MTATAPRHVHFVAIGGTGMGSLAGLLARRGVTVTGSDRALYPPMSTALEEWGIPVSLGFDPAHLDAGPGGRPDLVVIGNAVRSDNPEARAAIDGGLATSSFSDALYDLAIAGRHSVVVSGTHGKTTTTSLLAALLSATGRDPGVLVGGISLDLGGSFLDGEGEHFVVEGDEYDTAFFDKTPKFLHYHPRTLVLTSVEFDHADIYRDLEHVKTAFRGLVESLPAEAAIVAAVEEPNVSEVVSGAPCPVIGYAVGDEAPAAWCARSLAPDPEGTAFDLARDGRVVARARLPLHGRHNVANAVAALAVLERLGVPLEAAVAALPRFRGVKRRQEERGEAGGVLVIDDFAHHPTAVRETLAGLRARFPGRRLVAVFEPRSNTSRRAVFQSAYAEAFDAADRVLVCQVDDAPIYSAFGQVSERFSAATLAADLTARGRDARALPGVEAIVEDLAATSAPGDVVVTLSNGGFGGIWDALLERLG